MSKLDDLIEKIANPRMALYGSVFFMVVWFTTGLLHDFVLGKTYEEVQLADKSYLPWYRDYLGHYLSILTFIAAYAFHYFEPQIERMIGGREKYLKYRAPRMRFWFLLTCLVSLLMIVSNVMYVSFTSKNVAHWSHLFGPIFLPLFLAFVYYLLVLLPLFLSVVSLGLSIYQAVFKPTALTPFNMLDKEFCFGLKDLGNALYLIGFFILALLIPSIVIQIVQKQQVTWGSLIMVPFGLVVLVRASLIPSIRLIQKLSGFKNNKLEDLNQQIDELTSNALEREEVARLNQNIESLEAQKLIPVSQPFKILGLLVGLPAGGVAVIGWIADAIEVLKRFI